MSKKIYLLSFMLILVGIILFLPNMVNATVVETAEELKNVLSADFIDNKVVLNTNLTLSDSINIANGNIVLDLAGKTIEAVSNDNLLLQLFEITGGTLTIIDSKGNGTVKINEANSAYIFFVNGGKLVINDGTYENGKISIYCIDGEIVINGGKFISADTAIEVIHKTFLTINGGTFIGDLNHGLSILYLNEDGFVNINAGTFEGPNAGLFLSNPNKNITIKSGHFKSTSTSSECYGAIVANYYSVSPTFSILDLLDSKSTSSSPITLHYKQFDSYNIWYYTQVELDISRINYNIEISKVLNGTIIINKEKAAEGENISIQATPIANYVIDTLIVKTESGKDVTVTNNSFIMPAENVVVSATFKLLEDNDNSSNGEILDEKDETPKMGTTNMINYALILTVISLIGILTLKEKK